VGNQKRIGPVWAAAVWLALLIPSLASCASDDCTAAAIKLADDCGMGTGTTVIDGESAKDVRRCDGKTACHATCTNNASCDQITSTDKNNSYFKCLADCANK
jgi:hypothetical protein